jgi:hypothetical protein
MALCVNAAGVSRFTTLVEEAFRHVAPALTV